MQWQQPLDPHAPAVFVGNFEKQLEAGETIADADATTTVEAQATYGLTVGAVVIDGTKVKVPLSIASGSRGLSIWDFGGKRFPVEITATTSAGRPLQETALVGVRNT